MKRYLKIVIGILLLTSLSACNKYLDIVPDNVATLDYAFRLRSTAEKFLFTCYSYLPNNAAIAYNPGMTAAGEWWVPDLTVSAIPPANIIRGGQNVVNPYINDWEGRNNGTDLYQAIRECNTFLENIDKVPDLQEDEKTRWISEVKFLKAYYHFLLVRMYGPIIIVKKNLPVSASTKEVKRSRSPVDSCFSYIVQLMDEALPGLPDHIEDKVSEEGRITKAIDLSIKAYVLVTAASPLFNGNSDYDGFTNHDGTPLFNTKFDISKWQKAAEACKQAIQFCQSQGYHVQYYKSNLSAYQLSDTTLTKLGIRTAVSEKWNPEIIWGETVSMEGHVQTLCFPRGLDPSKRDNASVKGYCAPPLKTVNMFYTDHGVPITEDKTWDYAGRFELKKADSSNMYNLKLGYTTAKLNFNREPRFYADMGFDGSLWYGQGKFDDKDQWVVMAKKGQAASAINPRNYSTTGYFTKKLVNIQSSLGSGNIFNMQAYPWPIMRLANLYLLYAEALNEAQGPGPEVYKYLDLVRERAGIPPVEEAWPQYSKYPDKYKSKDGLREIIHRERSIEMAFEGVHYWDLLRWKQAINELNQPITGWDINQSDAEGYYRKVTIATPTFTTRDYLWPLSERVLLSNSSAVQNPGW